jgi:membrane protease YdiL (CAAX protease family)
MPEVALNLRLFLAALLSLITVYAIDRGTESRGLLPPGFRQLWRRGTATVVLWVLFYAVTFVPALTFDLAPELDLTTLGYGQLFIVNVILGGALAAWYCLGYVGVEGLPLEQAARGWLRVFGLHTRNLGQDLRLGLVAGLGAWMVVLAAAVALGTLLQAYGKGSWTGADQPVELIAWMASLPVLIRLAISLGAGVFEELFFRGFLQPRVGIGLSSLLFVVGHMSYGQPFMLFGITLLSLLYALLVRWTGNIWPAIVAHCLFDAIQLLFVIPGALEASGLQSTAVACGTLLGIGLF